MADLGKVKDKNAARLKRLDVLKVAQSMPMPDPMIGYKQTAQSPTGTRPADPEPTKSVAEVEQPEPLTEVKQEPEPTKEDDATKAEPVTDDASPQVAPKDQVTDREPEKVQGPDSLTPATKVSQTATEEVMTITLTYRFAEADLVRVDAVAKQMGVSAKAIFLKVSKTVNVGEADFKDTEERPRGGPTYRNIIKLPKEKAQAWIETNDPLGIKARPGDVLRKVAFNALDRTTQELLSELEKRKRNAG